MTQPYRYFKPGKIWEVDGQVWMVDRFQPVAILCDPKSGVIGKTLDWREVAPGHYNDEDSSTVLLGDGKALWSQASRSHPVVRILDSGLQFAVWTNGNKLYKCIDGAAWCRRTLNGLDSDAFEVRVSPTGEAKELRVRQRIDVAESRSETGGQRYSRWYAPRSRVTAKADGFEWYVGSSRRQPLQLPLEQLPLVVGVRSSPSDRLLEIDVGLGEVQAATAVGSRLFVAIARSRDGFGEILMVEGSSGRTSTVLDGMSVNISDRCWPMVTRPIESESYLHQMVALAAQPVLPERLISAGYSMTSSISGEWPLTRIVWDVRPVNKGGAAYRRSIALFDELGRIAYPINAATFWIEDLTTYGLPYAAGEEVGIVEL